MNEDLNLEKTIPKKVIEVNEDIHPIEDPLPQKVSLTLSSGYENGFAVINNWQVTSGKRVRGKIRTIGEYVAEQNLIKKYPTTKEIRTQLGIRKEYCKKLLAKARSIGMLQVHDKRSGHQFRYIVSNIKHFIIENKSDSITDNAETELVHEDTMLQLNILNNMISRENMSFHHINMKSKLRDNEDYARLNWTIRSQENKGKMFELKISRYRRCRIIVYPNGTVNMILKCTSDPIYLVQIEDVANFFSICGEILNVLKAETMNSEPLITDVANWMFTQFDASFDIPIERNDPASENKYTNKGLLSWKNFGYIRIKHIGHFYQLYSKNVLHKGEVLRLEKRFSFSTDKPTIKSLTSKLGKIYE